MAIFFMQLLALYRDAKGAISILWVIILPIVLGFIGLSLGICSCYLTRSELQTATDSAAVAATYSPLFTQQSLNSIVTLSLSLHGFDQIKSVTLIVNNPPTQGGYENTPNAIEVIATAPASPVWSLLTHSPTLSTRAVGLTGRLVE